MIRRDVLQRVGPMSEVFFLFYEEIDWSIRIRRAGYRLWYEPASVIYHKESMTAQRGTPLREFYMSRARMLFARRNLSGRNQTLSCLYISLIATPKKAIVHLLHGRVSLAIAVLKGVIHGMTAGLH